MVYTSRIMFRFFCLLLMFHTLALNTCDDLYLKLLGQSSKIMLLKNIEAEEESDTLDAFDDDDYLLSTSSFINTYSDDDYASITSKFHFHFSSTILAQLHYEIQIPPPRIIVYTLLA
jgi:hypothetical protein